MKDAFDLFMGALLGVLIGICSVALVVSCVLFIVERLS